MKAGGEREGEKGRLVQVLAVAALFPLFLFPLSSSAQRRPGRVLRPLNASTKALPPALKRALAVSDTLRFTGRRTVTVLKDGQPNTHEEIVVRDGPQVRIEFPPNGAYSGQVIVENATERRHFNAATNEVRVLPSRKDEGLQRLRAIVRAGRVDASPGERIAGYDTTDFLIRDAAGNPLQRLSIEPESGMVLRRTVYDATGVQAGDSVYTRVDLNPAPFDPALFRIERKGVQTSTPWDDLRRLARKGGYAAVGIPESTGFRLDTVRGAKPGGVPALLQKYSGPGGGVLTFYQLREAVDPSRLRQSVGRRLHTLSWTDGGLTYVLIGPQNDAVLGRLRASLTTAR